MLLEDSIKTYWNKTNFSSVKSSLSDLAESVPEIIDAKHSPSLLHFGGPSALLSQKPGHAFRDTEAAGAGAAERCTVDETNTETECEPQVICHRV